MEKETDINIEINNRVFKIVIVDSVLTTRDGDYFGHYEIMARVSNDDGIESYYPIKVID